MLSEKLLLFHDDINVNTKQLIEDIENYIFDEKTGDIKKQQRDDTIDSLEYATKLYYNAPISA
jgi:site-specific DNA-adenine methylase